MQLRIFLHPISLTLGYLPFIIRFVVRQLEFLSTAYADPEMPGLRAAPLGDNLNDLMPLPLPCEFQRPVCITETGMACNQFTPVSFLATAISREPHKEYTT